MNDILIVYKTKYGATGTYARWLAEELGCEAVAMRDARMDEVLGYGTVLVGSGVYGSRIAAAKFVEKHADSLRGRRVAVFAVGAAVPDAQNSALLRQRNLVGEIENTPLFSLRGAWTQSALNRRDRLVCSLRYRTLGKRDPADLRSWERALLASWGRDADWTDRDSIAPVIAFAKGGAHAPEGDR